MNFILLIWYNNININKRMNKNQYCDNPEKYYEYTKNMSRDDFKNLQEYCDIYLYEKKSAKGKIKQGVYDLGKDLENIPDIIVNSISNSFSYGLCCMQVQRMVG